MLLMLLGCFRTTSDAPFELGRLRSAMLVPDDLGGVLLLSDREMTCGGFLDEVSNRVDEVDSTVWNDNGVLIQLWNDGTLDGTYVQNLTPFSTGQWFAAAGFDEGVIYDDPTPGTLELTGQEGHLQTGWMSARFEATTCTD